MRIVCGLAGLPTTVLGLATHNQAVAVASDGAVQSQKFPFSFLFGSSKSEPATAKESSPLVQLGSKDQTSKTELSSTMSKKTDGELTTTENDPESDDNESASNEKAFVYTDEMKKGFCDDLLHLLVEKQTDQRRKTKDGALQVGENGTEFQTFNNTVNEVTDALVKYPFLFDEHSPIFMRTVLGNDKLDMGMIRDVDLLGSDDKTKINENTENRNTKNSTRSIGKKGDNFASVVADSSPSGLHAGSSLIEQESSADEHVDASEQGYDLNDFKEMFDHVNGHEKNPWTEIIAKHGANANQLQTKRKSPNIANLIAITKVVLNGHVEALESKYSQYCPDQDKKEDAFLEQCKAKNVDVQQRLVKEKADRASKSGTASESGKSVDSASNLQEFIDLSIKLFDQGLRLYKAVAGKSTKTTETDAVKKDDIDTYSSDTSSKSNNNDSHPRNTTIIANATHATAEQYFLKQIAVWKVGAFYDDAKYLFRGVELKKAQDKEAAKGKPGLTTQLVLPDHTTSLDIENSDSLLENYCGNIDRVSALSDMEKIKDSISSKNADGSTSTMVGANLTDAMAQIFENIGKTHDSFSKAETSVEKVSEKVSQKHEDSEQKKPSSFLEQDTKSEKGWFWNSQESKPIMNSRFPPMPDKIDPGKAITLADPGKAITLTGEDDIGTSSVEMQKSQKNYQRMQQKANEQMAENVQSETSEQLMQNADAALSEETQVYNNKHELKKGCDLKHWVGRPFKIVNKRSHSGCMAISWDQHWIYCYGSGRHSFVSGFVLSPKHKLINIGGLECQGDRRYSIRCNRGKGDGNIEAVCVQQSGQWHYTLRNSKDTTRNCANEHWRIICNRPHVNTWELYQFIGLNEAWDFNKFAEQDLKVLQATKKIADSALGEAKSVESVIQKGKSRWDQDAKIVDTSIAGYSHRYEAWDDAYKWAKAWHNSRVGGRPPKEALTETYKSAKATKDVFAFIMQANPKFDETKTPLPYRYEAWEFANKWGKWTWDFLHTNIEGRKRFEEIDEAYRIAGDALNKASDWLKEKPTLIKLMRGLGAREKDDKAKVDRLASLFMTYGAQTYKFMWSRYAARVNSIPMTLNVYKRSGPAAIEKIAIDSQHKLDSVNNTLTANDKRLTAAFEKTIIAGEELKKSNVEHVAELKAFKTKTENDIQRIEDERAVDKPFYNNHLIDLKTKSEAQAQELSSAETKLQKLAIDDEAAQAKLDEAAEVQTERVRKAVGLAEQQAAEWEKRAREDDAKMSSTVDDQDRVIAAKIEESDKELLKKEVAVNKKIEEKDKELSAEEARLRKDMSAETQKVLTHFLEVITKGDNHVKIGLLKKVDVHDESLTSTLTDLNTQLTNEHTEFLAKDRELEEERAKLERIVQKNLDTLKTDIGNSQSKLDSRFKQMNTHFQEEVKDATRALQEADTNLANTEKEMQAKEENLQKSLETADHTLRQQVSDLGINSESFKSNIVTKLNGILNGFYTKADGLVQKENGLKLGLDRTNKLLQGSSRNVIAQLDDLHNRAAQGTHAVADQEATKQLHTRQAILDVEEEDHKAQANIRDQFDMEQAQIEKDGRSLWKKSAEKVTDLNKKIAALKASTDKDVRDLESQAHMKTSDSEGGVADLLADLNQQKSMTKREIATLNEHAATAQRSLEMMLNGEKETFSMHLNQKEKELGKNLKILMLYQKTVKARQADREKKLQDAIARQDHEAVARIRAAQTELSKEERDMAATMEALKQDTLRRVAELSREMHTDEENLKATLAETNRKVKTVEREVTDEEKAIRLSDKKIADALEHALRASDLKLEGGIHSLSAEVTNTENRFARLLADLGLKDANASKNLENDLQKGTTAMDGRITNSLKKGEEKEQRISDEIVAEEAREDAARADLDKNFGNFEATAKGRVSHLSGDLSKSERKIHQMLLGAEHQAEEAFEKLGSSLGAQDRKFSAALSSDGQAIGQEATSIGNSLHETAEQSHKAQVALQTAEKSVTRTLLSQLLAGGHQLNTEDERLHGEMDQMSNDNSNHAIQFRDLLKKDERTVSKGLEGINSSVDKRTRETLAQLFNVHASAKAADKKLANRLSVFQTQFSRVLDNENKSAEQAADTAMRMSTAEMDEELKSQPASQEPQSSGLSEFSTTRSAETLTPTTVDKLSNNSLLEVENKNPTAKNNRGPMQKAEDGESNNRSKILRRE